MFFLSSLSKKDLANRICLLRVDFNIQDINLSKNNLRILAVLPTIKFLIGKGAKIIILSHRGRPLLVKRANLKSQIPVSPAGKSNLKIFSLKPFAKILSYLLKNPVDFIDFQKSDFRKLKNKIKNSSSSGIFLLENLRFISGEEKNDDKFAKQLASLGDFYVNDAFAVSHRNNASVSRIARYLPSYAGLLMEKEIKNLNEAIKNPKKPLVVILGGVKISDKIGLIENFLKKADYFLIGGGMANTFFAAQGLPVGNSLYEEKMISLARELLKFKKIILPIDTAVHKRQILDIGPETIEKYSKIIENAKTVVWNGPMGYIEDKRFKKGSEAIAGAIIKSKAFSIIGGGETVSILDPQPSILSSNIFISTGGGAMLEYLAGKKLPGIKALN